MLDPNGRPVGGARVHAGPRGGHLIDLPNGLRGTAARPAPVLTDADGSFDLPNDFEPGVHPLFVVARGYPAREEMVEIAENRRSFVEVRLEPPARIEGRLVASSGEPVADAWVGEGLDQTTDGLRLEHRVPVHEDEEIVHGPCDTGVEREWLAGIGLPDDADAWQA